MAEDSPQLETTGTAFGVWTGGQLQTTLRERRAEVVSHLEGQLRTPVISELVFDLLVHLALNADAELDEALVESFAWRHELEPSEAAVQSLDGQRVPLSELLTNSSAGESLELVNGLATLGFANKIQPLEEGDRRSFTLRVVGLLPGVERIGPYNLSDYIDLVCSEADAGRFWQLYAERLANEVGRRGQNADLDTIPWFLHHLLLFHRRGAPEVRGRAWVTLRRHIKRVLRVDRNRSQFVRALLEGIDDLAALHYICSSPALAGDAQFLHHLLTRGDEKLISCALFALQIHGELDHVVARTLQYFRSRPLPEVAHRITELYAQLSLPPHPNANLRNLQVGLRTVMLDQVNRGGSVESLAQAIAHDTRALRHGMLIADLGRDGEFRASAPGQRLLDRVVTIFFQSFTPTAVDHPLNDELFTSSMVRVLRIMLEEGVGRVRDRLESFGVELADHVERWTGDGAPLAIRNKLLARFAVVYARTVIAVARILHSQPETAELGRSLYRSLIRVYLEHYKALEGDSSFGAVEFALKPLFPDMIGASIEQIDIGDIIDASHSIAALEGEFGAFDDDDEIDVNDGRSVLGISALVLRKPDREKPISSKVELLSRRQGIARSILRAYSGLDLISHMKDGLYRIVGLRREGEIMLTDRELVISSKRSIAGRVLERTGDSHSLDDLRAVHVRRRLRLFYFVLGILGLICAGLIGGHLLFVGLRGADSSLAMIGGGLLLIGLLFDAAMSRESERNANTVILDLHFNSPPKHFSLALEIDEGAEILDAFMAGDAERRELALMEGVLHKEVDWEPLDGPIELS